MQFLVLYKSLQLHNYVHSTPPGYYSNVKASHPPSSLSLTIYPISLLSLISKVIDKHIYGILADSSVNYNIMLS